MVHEGCHVVLSNHATYNSSLSINYCITFNIVIYYQHGYIISHTIRVSISKVTGNHRFMWYVVHIHFCQHISIIHVNAQDNSKAAFSGEGFPGDGSPGTHVMSSRHQAHYT